jgi:hypothetical protein
MVATTDVDQGKVARADLIARYSPEVLAAAA